ncbi:hypothetical protein NPIL_275731, partial [Nephila pilipes]
MANPLSTQILWKIKVGSKPLKSVFASHCIRIQGESSSSDPEAVKRYPEKIRNIIEEQGCSSYHKFSLPTTLDLREKNAWQNIYIE